MKSKWLGNLAMVVLSLSIAIACSSTKAGACEENEDCPSNQICSGGTCVAGNRPAGTSSSGGTSGSSSSAALCDTSRSGWCSCYVGANASTWWVSSSSVASCPSSTCCYRYQRDTGTTGCSCTNEVSRALCQSTATTARGTVVSSCPGGLGVGSGSSSSSSGSSSSSSSGGSGSSGGACGEPCATGCCSLTGRICCKPPFCSGDCVGSPCC